MDEQMIEKCYRQNAQYQRAVRTGIGFGKRINRVRALRRWEREGVIRPSRTTTGARVYDDNDIVTLKQIASERTRQPPR
jgi:hypothetical protein